MGNTAMPENTRIVHAHVHADDIEIGDDRSYCTCNQQAAWNDVLAEGEPDCKRYSRMR